MRDEIMTRMQDRTKDAGAEEGKLGKDLASEQIKHPSLVRLPTKKRSN